LFYIFEDVPNFHSSKQSSSSKIDLTATGSSSAGAEKSLAKAKAHAIIMAFSWMLFASTGIIIARYFKFMLPEKKLLGTKIWFTIHRPLMVFTCTLSIIALLIILAYLDWKWIKTSEPVNFAHSIFGIVTISLSFFQVRGF